MAKKKKNKKQENNKIKFGSELTGLILVLISVIGIGSFGPVGHLIKSFAIFVMGLWWAVLIILLLVLGTFMILNRDVPKFFTPKLIGLYILVVALLSVASIDYIVINPDFKLLTVMQNVIDMFLNTINDGNYFNLSQMGGGLVGAFFAWSLVSLVELKGAYIVLIVFSIFGLIMIFNLNFSDVLSNIKKFILNIKSKLSNIKSPEKKAYNLEQTGALDKVIISSSEDVKIHRHTEKQEEQIVAPYFENSVNGEYQLPAISLLDLPKKTGKGNSTEFLSSNKVVLERVLNDFQIMGKVVEIHEGPAVTQYEVEIKAATKLNRITSIHKEIALALAAKDVRIEAPIPGKRTVGIEIPNVQIATVPIREVFNSVPKNMQNAKILIALGKDLMGKNRYADLQTMPHLLVAGSTGSGKSVCINSFIASILMFKRPDEVKLVLVDPKKVELSNYNGIPHLLWPVVTDPKKANVALQRIVFEMDRRYTIFEEKGAKNLASYNDMITKENRKNDIKESLLPYIVVIIDELADLMLVSAKEVEDSIMRITQMARAAGIHLIVATQRPSTDIITGIVKANIPSRIAFTVASYIDSRTILDATGAEKLLGRGDMLYLPMGENHPMRIQGTFISDEEIARLIEYVSKEQTVKYDSSLLEEAPNHMAAGAGFQAEEYEDPIYNEVVDFALEAQKISASLIQRRFRVGYNRAARILDLLEERGIVGPSNGSKPRDVLMKVEEN